jgi:hypothetical protein
VIIPEADMNVGIPQYVIKVMDGLRGVYIGLCVWICDISDDYATWLDGPVDVGCNNLGLTEFGQYCYIWLKV